MSDSDQNFIEQPEVSYRPIAIRYALIGVLAMVGADLIFNLTGLVDYTNSFNPGNFLAMIVSWGILFTVLMLAIKKHREEDLGGYITFGRAFGVSFLTGLFIALISIIWFFLFFNFIDPTIIDTVRENTMEKMVNEQGLSEQEAENAMAFAKMFMSPVAMSLFGFLGRLFAVVIIGLISAAIMQKKAPGMA